MNGITWIHIAGGMTALACGAIAATVQKGGNLHAKAGTWFCVSMFVLGVTASILSPFKTPPDSPIGGIMVCYFVATAWMAAHNRSGTPGRFDKIACTIILLIAVAMVGEGVRLALNPGGHSGPPGPIVLIVMGALCLLAGLADLRFIIRGKLPVTQRVTRHLWRICFAFFIATGSFFLGQQDVLPLSVRGSSFLYVLAFAPFALMLYWLVRVRLSKVIGQTKLLEAAATISVETHLPD